MMALTKVLAGAGVMAAVLAAAPAAAQYYPYGGGYGAPQVNPSYGYGYGNGYAGANQQAAVAQCTAAVQQRLGGNYGYGYSGYGNGGGRVLGISRIEPHGDGGLTVRGVASSGAYGGYNQQPDLTFRCRTDFRGMITNVDVRQAQRAYTPYGTAPNGYANPYGQSQYNTGPYGYSRY